MWFSSYLSLKILNPSPGMSRLIVPVMWTVVRTHGLDCLWTLPRSTCQRKLEQLEGLQFPEWPQLSHIKWENVIIILRKLKATTTVGVGVYCQLRNSINCDIKRLNQTIILIWFKKTKEIQKNSGKRSKVNYTHARAPIISEACVLMMLLLHLRTPLPPLWTRFVSIGKKLAKNFPDVSAQPEVNPSISSPGFSFQPST